MSIQNIEVFLRKGQTFRIFRVSGQIGNLPSLFRHGLPF